MAVILAVMSLFYKYVHIPQDESPAVRRKSDEEKMALVDDSSAAGNYESSLKTDVSEL